MPKVLLATYDAQVAQMFLRNGWIVVGETGAEPDLVQFCGGPDVSPHLYNESKHPATNTSPKRDELDVAKFINYPDTPKAGICRGGQFLNVMSGGKLWQDVNGHRGSHMAKDHLFGVEVEVTSTHHQMMIPSPKARVLLDVSPALSSYRQGADGVIKITKNEPDVEAVFYENTLSLCYQPHPEYYPKENQGCEALYFDYLAHFFGLQA